MSRLVRAGLGRVRSLGRRIDAAVVAPGRPGSVVLLQVALALIIASRLLAHDWILISERPAELTHHLWILGWLPHLPPPALVAIQVAGLAGAALVVARRAPRAGLVLSWLSLLVLAGLWGASGKFHHNDVLLLTATFPVLFARAPVRAHPSTDPADRMAHAVTWGWTPRAALAVVGCVYFLTGLQKVRHSGLAWVFSDNMSWVLLQGADSSPVSTELVRSLAETPVLPQLLAGGALALELAAPLLLCWRPTRLVFAGAVTAMHLSIWVCLGLDYSPWWLTVWAVTIATGVPTGWAAVRERVALRRAGPVPLDPENALDLPAARG
ncbi:hypothetical protein ACFS27_10010 [Promicromonospora vindobonensis]|uniref:Vitamin K-dependent gamma-carboxylase-like protein n=1 Tax=Promicromonospora vindobonensis TaxID=195748 RepID=A0ABW5VQI7_9MICO